MPDCDRDQTNSPQSAPKAYSYLRFSTPEQMQGDSFRRQTTLAREYADRNGLQLDTETSFRDLGVSAYQGRNMETGALGLFREAVEEGIIKSDSYLLVESLDRISRQSARKASRVLEDICDMGITVVTLHDGKAYTRNLLDKDPVAFLMAVLIFMRANEESATKARRLRSVWQGKREKIAKGQPVRLTSRCPQWLTPSDDNTGFEIIPERGEVVRRIFSLALEGVGKASITELLNTESVPVFGRGKQWHTSYVDKILHSSATYGTLTPYSSRAERKADREALDPIENYYPAVIERDVFERVQALRSSKAPRRGRHSKAPLQNILGSLATCPLCNSTMTRVTKNKSKGWIYLACQKARQGAGCSYNAVRYDLVEPAIKDQMGQLVADCPTGDDSLDGKIEETRASLEGTESTLSNLLEAIENGLDPNQYPSVGERLRNVEEERDRLQAELTELTQQEHTFSGEMAIRRASNLLEAVRETPEDVTLINSLMRESFDKVVVDFETGNLVFHWKHGGETNIVYTM